MFIKSFCNSFVCNCLPQSLCAFMQLHKLLLLGILREGGGLVYFGVLDTTKFSQTIISLMRVENVKTTIRLYIVFWCFIPEIWYGGAFLRKAFNVFVIVIFIFHIYHGITGICISFLALISGNNL